MTRLSTAKILSAAVLAATAAAGVAYAQAEPGGVGLQPAATALAEEVHFFHNGVLMPIITGISLFVLALLLWVMLRYNSKANPTPKKFSHNTLLEVVWTGVPIIILLVIALFSFDLLYNEDIIPDGKQVVAQGDGATTEFVFNNDFPKSRQVARSGHLQVLIDSGAGVRALKYRKDYTVEGFGDSEINVTLESPPAPGERVLIRGGRSVDIHGEVVLAPTVTLKVTGRQWGWNYAYPDFGDFEFTSDMLPEDQTTSELYRFEADNHVVVPVGETIRVTVTAADVIHAWAMPAFAVKIDAVPGRINETWFRADEEGVYYGQCSEICGIRHAFMPIVVEVVSRPAFEAWVDEQRALAGMEPMFSANVKLAAAGSKTE
ncbi:MAG: cytochrome c oxidase subunit II transmembrane domain-containing protein [Parvularculaceae bacterium]